MNTEIAGIPAFDRAVQRIRDYYQSNPTGMGWRFAYGPADALRSDLPIWLIGQNPGGDGPDKAETHRTDGNGFRLEGWSDAGSKNKLQKNVEALFSLLERRLSERRDDLLDKCFTANVCPFRSPSAAELNRILPRWRAFCETLWPPLLQEYQPKTIVCLGDTARSIMESALISIGFSELASRANATGWGSVTWTKSIFRGNGHATKLVRVPHLSRFTIFTSSKCTDQSEEIADAIVSDLRAS